MGYDVKVLNLGAGVDSSAMLLASEFGLWNVPKVDYAVYIDTGADPWWVGAQIEKLRSVCKTPIHIVKTPRPLRDLVLDSERVVAIPCYTEPRGMGSCHCSDLVKVRWIRRHIREECGVKFKARMKKTVLNLIGMDAEESQRAIDRSCGVYTIAYPLVEAGKTREDCRNLMKQYGLGTFHRSSCAFCPLHRKRTWCAVAKFSSQEEWEGVKEVDRGIREQYLEKKGLRQYLHYRRDAIDEIDWEKEYQSMTDDDKRHFEKEWG